MAFSLACRRVPVYFSWRTNLQGSVATLSTHVTTTESTHAQCCAKQCEEIHSTTVSRNHWNLSRTDPTSSSENNDIFLSGILSKLSLSPAELNLTNEYLLPSVFPSSARANILDPVPNAQVRDCPTSVVRDIMERPLGQNNTPIEAPPSARRPIEKRAKRIMKIRRKKMKKHQYRKWKKRNKFKLRAMFAKREKKKKKLWEELLEGYRYKGLTQDFIDWHTNKTKEEAALFLNHLGIPLEEETPEVLEKRRESERLKAKKLRTRYDPLGSMIVTPTPILPEGASVKRVFAEQEQKARERMEKHLVEES